jgi:acid phosphatase family membrane protein YuiD
MSSVSKNSAFITAVCAFVLAQSFKVITHRCERGQQPLRWRRSRRTSHVAARSTLLRAVLCARAVCASLLSRLMPQVRVPRNRVNEGKWDVRQLVTSGGMPSSHSALVRGGALPRPVSLLCLSVSRSLQVAGLTMAVGLDDGFGEPLFAACFVFSVIVMYDASGVRLHAGRQAEVLNQIICELPPSHPVADTRPLRDSLGHTPVQVVAGGLLGALVALVRASMLVHSGR